jgi:membrane protein implicated in regulation of membrane protease activity
VKHLRVAFLVALALVVLGLLGVLLTIIALAVAHPSGDASMNTPPLPFMVSVGVFALGAVGYVAFGAPIVRRLRAMHGQSRVPSATDFSAVSALWRFIRTGDVN